ncbi:aminomethyl-transferring glycine dehydrogenase subunit GcvPA [Calorimonas adulescens]|jgi:glycine dehydrogenase (decarboxylating) alpha subunit (EC 1.4.4.2)|uniref:Probable glycine dehydrogenase (decarboxylating) subunit 1 n=1 Tax=Calorimonas adulescens TaxID=2606906 RepID=A0A5D8Q8S3_9THEO|nr:aminomethyl-transferring glycine dehydrogenase subunit GcvPA [Calorimonas adulescens]TZE81175.1 aminomethyl-transferring glycine dehydrogenase subunit GcvPA [Calorimonas adulescens]
MDYIPNTDVEREEMLRAIGASSIEDLFSDIPEDVKFNGRLNLPEAMSELEVKRHMTALAESNAEAEHYTYFIGGGIYDHYIPSAVSHITGRSEFYTAYTPYQPEVSQGTLQSIFEYQSMICELTGMDVSNASMYDGASAMAEAGLMAVKIRGKGRILVSKTVHPEYRRVLETYAAGMDIDIVEVDYKDGATDVEDLKAKLSEVDCLIVQNPNFFGCIEDVRMLSGLIHEAGGLFIAVVDPLSLGILKAPGDYGADIVCGDGQALGNPMNFGGPHLGFLATREQFVRSMPGRIVGQTIDNRGNTGYVLTMQTREQHIRREKATSNICSNQALCALAATVYLSLMGKKGLKEVGEQCLAKSHYLAGKLREAGFSLAFDKHFFKEFVIKLDGDVSSVIDRLLEKKIIAGIDLSRFYPELKGCMMIAVTEKRTKQEMDELVAGLEGLR